MADGPYRNLPLNGRWRKAADALSEDATTVAEACDLFADAVHRDIRDQDGVALTEALKDLFGTTPQTHLFGNDPIAHLEALGETGAQTPFNDSLIRHASLAVSRGQWGEAELEHAVASAVREVANAGLNAVQEHSTDRKSEQEILAYTRSRCEDVRATLDADTIARRVLQDMQPPKTQPIDPENRLEEGPRL